MKLQVPYGKDGKLEAEIEDKCVLGVIEPNEVKIGDETEVIRQALANPIGSPSLKEFLKDARDVLFIVNDPTRPTPTARVIDMIQDDIAGHKVSFIVATGIHRAPTEEEYIQIFSEKYYKKYKDVIHSHDAKRDEMVYLGTSKNGTEMKVNKRGVDAHKIVIISSVEPHYFAGYTGGRKSFLPGIAAHETIEQNHKLALKQEACALKLKGNPVHEDMIDALSTVKKEIFTISTVLDKNHRIYAATAGIFTNRWKPRFPKPKKCSARRYRKRRISWCLSSNFPRISICTRPEGNRQRQICVEGRRHPAARSQVPHGHRGRILRETAEVRQFAQRCAGAH